MTTKHTPGPWVIGVPSEQTIFGKSDYIGSDEIPQRVAVCGTSGLYHQNKPESDLEEESKANARLIAAAPEMLEALKMANNLIEIARQHFPKLIHNADRFQLESACAAIGTVIAKIEGEVK